MDRFLDTYKKKTTVLKTSKKETTEKIITINELSGDESDNYGQSSMEVISREYKRSYIVNHDVFKRIYREIVFSIPVAWNTNDKTKELAFFGNGVMATYYEFKKYTPQLISEFVNARKRLLHGVESYAFACDGWSALRHGVNLEAFFVTFFHRASFRSVLLDAHPIKKSAALDIQTALQDSCKPYNLDAFRKITTDSATNNTSAFADRRSPCMAHALSITISHLMNGNLPKSEFPDLYVLRDHFRKVNSFCNQVKSRRVEFLEYVQDNMSINVDFADINDVPLPQTISPTRWLGVAIQMEWLLKYGILYDRFLSQTEADEFADMTYFLGHMQETAYIIFMLDNSLNLLAREDRPSLHLVIPVLYTLNKILSDGINGVDGCPIHFTSPLSKMLAKVILYELEKGSLVIPEQSREHFEIATAFLPGVSSLIDEKTFEKCKTSLKNEVKRLISMQDSPWDEKALGSDVELFFNYIHRPDTAIEKNLLIHAIIPCEDKCILSGSSARYIREIECKFTRRNKDLSLTQVRDVLKGLKANLIRYERREQELEEARAIKSQFDNKRNDDHCSTDEANAIDLPNPLNKCIEKCAKMRLAKETKREARNKKKSEAVEKRRNTIKRKNGKQGKQSDEVNDSNGNDGTGNVEVEIEGGQQIKRQTVSTTSSSTKRRTIQQILSKSEYEQYQAVNKLINDSQRWKKNSEDIRKEIKECEQIIEDMENSLRKSIQELSQTIVEETKREEEEERKKVEEVMKTSLNEQQDAVDKDQQIVNEVMEEVIDMTVEEKFSKKNRHELPEGSERLWSFKNVYHFLQVDLDKNGKDPHASSVVEKIMDDVLSIPATEAVCERLFRICSGIARRNYVTKIKPETVQTLTTLHYFREAAIALLSHEDVVAHL